MNKIFHLPLEHLTFFHPERNSRPHLLPVEPVRNPDLGPEAPRGVPAGDSIMILEKIIEIPLPLRLQYKLTMLGKKLLMHFCKIWVLQLDLALRYDFIHTYTFIKCIFQIYTHRPCFEL